MKLRNWVVAATAALALTTISGLSGYIGYRTGTNKPVQEYMGASLDRVMKSEAEKLHIRHKGKPTLFYRFGRGVMRYDPSYNTISVDVNHLTSPKWAIENFILRKLTQTAEYRDELLHHELGHFHADELSEQYLSADFPKFKGRVAEGTITSNEDYAAMFITEGIATYFERKMSGNDKDDFKDSDWPRDINKRPEAGSQILYDGSYHFVKPVIEQHGDRGMLTLIKFPPTNYLTRLPEYRSKILEAFRTQ